MLKEKVMESSVEEVCTEKLDVTDMEEKIEKASEEWKRTFDAISDLVFVLDKDHRFVRVNKATCDFLKKEPEELIGKRCFEVLHGTNKPIQNCPCEKMSTTKETETIEIYDPVLDKSFLITVSPLLDYENEYIGCVHIARDITKRKRMEDKLRSYSENLEELVEERTRELKKSQEQLIKSERLAAIGELATMVGHDLRNP